MARALASNELTPSGGSSMPAGMGSTSCGARIARYSSSLWALRLARTKRIRALSPAALERGVAPPAPRSAGDRRLLHGGDARHAAGGQVEQPVERLARERLALGGGLHLDQTALAGHHDVHVERGRRVFFVVEVEPRLAVDHADRYGGHVFEQRQPRPARHRLAASRGR